ncbi:hypothetical protein [Pseudomonas cannabina]|uniref:Uncharacterized protein n=1 Tax=Pseudomonas cannabina pv. alisalensis TaxID=757414 RepID=A0ABS1XLQ9_PSEC1|nr:hypothetical protein [Pseudomonas cannabina]MBM0142432.1 hypothetical protein [Pseudomonas cannabina pv. alisalensis]
MSDELERRISQKVFEEVGITIGSKDPIYALAVICKEIVKEDKEEYIELQQHIIREIRDIPFEIGKTVERISLAVEEAENTAATLCKSSRDLLKVNSAAIIEETKKSLDLITRDQVAIALSQINLSFSALEIRAKSLGADTPRRIPRWLSTGALSLSLLVCILLFPPVVFFQVMKNADLDHQVNYFARELIALERSVANQPKPVQENIKRTAEKEKKDL